MGDEGKVDRVLSKARNKSPDKGVNKPQAKDEGKVDRVLSKAGNKSPDMGVKKPQALAKKRPKTVGKKKSMAKSKGDNESEYGERKWVKGGRRKNLGRKNKFRKKKTQLSKKAQKF